MTIQNDTKFEEEWTPRFKIGTTIWRILTQTLKYITYKYTYISRTSGQLLKNQFINFVKPYHEELSNKVWSV